MSLQADLNRLAGTTGLDAQGAANVWAGTTGRDLVGALNVVAGTVGVELNGVIKLLAATYGGNPALDSGGALGTAIPIGPPDDGPAEAAAVALAASNASVGLAPPAENAAAALAAIDATVSAVAGGATFTLYPSNQTGHIVSQSTSSFALARAGTGDSLGASPTAAPTIGQRYFPGDSYDPARFDVWEGFFDFDLATVTGTIVSATLSVGANFNGADTPFTVEARLRDWGATLTSADWVAGASLSGLTLLASLASSSVSGGVYLPFTESGTALKDAVVATGAGTLRMLLCSDRTRTNVEPSGDEFLIFEAYNSVSFKPKLVVVTS